MGDPYGLVTWPGMVAFESASITLIHGITPSVAQIAMQPQDGNVDIDGTMTFEYDGMTKTFINCHADYGSFRWDESGAVWEIAIFDRRWWWRFGWVAGEYNIVMPDAKLKMDTEKAPQDLAKLCLKAMGEDDWDVGDLPNDSRPTSIGITRTQLRRWPTSAICSAATSSRSSIQAPARFASRAKAAICRMAACCSRRRQSTTQRRRRP